MPEQKRLIPEFYELAVEYIMDKGTWDLPLVEKDADIHHVLAILRGKSHVWVVDNMENKNVLGVITEHDVLSILAPKKLPPYVFGIPNIKSLHHGTANTASEVMSKKLVKCSPRTSIKEALNKMNDYGVRRLPVTDNGRIVGEITLHQIISKYYAATQYHPLKGD
ncbi:MAG: CBS domain-containing protein [Candidatus Thermoplasmatota archaeon]|nr:CBS domain-containing protein [archaeon]MBU2564693.1 CBS domain-containing protein [Candidatus Thermoplasmatota archaeon]MBU4189460.1 CBS domain-containing protein [Candidatus Thermoplasmatota archaeon]MBU4256154.1 CBS domain-containing protein [Candidatus Thermoplasmatota archaeon]MCG2825334.1 CBS domain-containing protein [Thermoplasmatales archaeon]